MFSAQGGIVGWVTTSQELLTVVSSSSATKE
jgi:hypothetical protein